MKRHYLYVTTCKVNGKKYVGQHITRCKTIEGMMNDRYLGSGTILIRAMKKYGHKQFSKEILCVCDTQEEIDQMEIGYIESHDVLDHPDKWYNRAAGGQYGRGERHSEITSMHMKEINKRPETRKKRGWLSVEEMEAKRLKSKRLWLIITLKIIRNKKWKIEREEFAHENGFKSWRDAVSKTRPKPTMTLKWEESISIMNEWQRTPIGRFTMSWKKRGTMMDGFGKYSNEQFSRLLEDKGISNIEASRIIGCHHKMITIYKRGWSMRTKDGIKVKTKAYVKNEAYDAIKRA
jgi:hypothetical protein